MTVGWILRDKGRHVESAPPETSLCEIIHILAARRIGAVVIADASRRVKGIISERDIVRILSEAGSEALRRPVSEFMTKTVVTCTEHQSIDWVMGEMTAGRFRHLPVIEGGTLTGIVSIGDVVKYKLAMAEEEAAQMRQYIAS